MVPYFGRCEKPDRTCSFHKALMRLNFGLSRRRDVVYLTGGGYEPHYLARRPTDPGVT